MSRYFFGVRFHFNLKASLIAPISERFSKPIGREEIFFGLNVVDKIK